MHIINSNAPPKIDSEKDYRQYVRLDTVLPVQFRFLAQDASSNLSDWLQGFTNNLSKGGICLCVNNLPQELVRLIKENKAKIGLEIDLPISRKPITALGSAIWLKENFGAANKYCIGLRYEKIEPAANNKLMRYAWGRRLLVPIGAVAIILLALGLALNSFFNVKLIEANKVLVNRLVNVAQQAEAAKRKIKNVSQEKAGLERKIEDLALRIQAIDDEKARIGSQNVSVLNDRSKKINEMNILIKQLSQEKERLKEKLLFVQFKENAISQELAQLNEKRVTLERENFDRMYQWVKLHQNPRTSLVMSFEGDGDVSNWAFLYDQSLAALAYTYFGDFDRSQKIFNFFETKAKKKSGFFYNAYYVNDGEPAEYITHSGPNIWLGIAIAQYTYKSNDQKYMRLAQQIADGIINLQKQDAENGIRGGPDAGWFSTEHNLDAYAFFNMLYKLTGKQKYADARDNTFNWLLTHTYDKTDIPIKRGKGDSTIATDTYAWSIAAIGPEKLEKSGMNPDKIMEFAESACAVEVSYIRPEGRVIKIKGFDFSPQRHLARGGLVSSEWTSQMVISFKKMSEFHYSKGENSAGEKFRLKADEYLASLSSMVISSPSPSGQGGSCLPYATQDFADTGHGWLTPKGKSTGSLAGTTYTIFAYYGYNPLELKE